MSYEGDGLVGQIRQTFTNTVCVQKNIVELKVGCHC